MRAGIKGVPSADRLYNLTGIAQMANIPINEANILAVLTNRERQITRLVSKGFSNKEIGRQLKIVDGTIKVHLHNIFQKLGITNRTLLAAIAFKTAEEEGE